MFVVEWPNRTSPNLDRGASILVIPTFFFETHLREKNKKSLCERVTKQNQTHVIGKFYFFKKKKKKLTQNRVFEIFRQRVRAPKNKIKNSKSHT